MVHRIIVADDVKMNRKLIIDVLSNWLPGGLFLEASNGFEVLNYLEVYDNISLIMLDLIMPELDGHEVLKKVKTDPRFAHIPVIVNSAMTDKKSIRDTLEEGAIDYFMKPLSQEDREIVLPLKAKNALLLYEQNKTINDLNKVISEELKNAHEFQNIMLPKTGNMPSIDLHIKYYPSLGIGGDFFDCVTIGNKTWFMIADVTGHGIAASMASSMIKVMFRMYVEKGNIRPSGVLARMNKWIFDTFDLAEKYTFIVFTAFIGCIEDHTLSYCNAGQPYPLLYQKGLDSVIKLDKPGSPIGMFDFAVYEQYCITLAEGDAIFLYTDGLFSSGQKSDFVNWERVFKFSREFRSLIKSDPELFLEEIKYYFHLQHKAADSDASFTDDVALMMIKIK